MAKVNGEWTEDEGAADKERPSQFERGNAFQLRIVVRNSLSLHIHIHIQTYIYIYIRVVLSLPRRTLIHIVLSQVGKDNYGISVGGADGAGASYRAKFSHKIPLDDVVRAPPSPSPRLSLSYRICLSLHIVRNCHAYRVRGCVWW